MQLSSYQATAGHHDWNALQYCGDLLWYYFQVSGLQQSSLCGMVHHLDPEVIHHQHHTLGVLKSPELQRNILTKSDEPVILYHHRRRYCGYLPQYHPDRHKQGYME
jgi:hypothetical protein